MFDKGKGTTSGSKVIEVIEDSRNPPPPLGGTPKYSRYSTVMCRCEGSGFLAV